MKRILIALALVLSVQVASAQATADAARKAIDKARVATENPKKVDKVATWLALGKAYMGAYNQPTVQVLRNSSKAELKLLMNEKQTAPEQKVVVADNPMTKQTFANKELYFNSNDVLIFVNVTKYPVEDPLYKAFEAYKMAHTKDLSGSKTKDIAAAMQTIADSYAVDAEVAYNLGDYATSSAMFEKAAEVTAAAPLNKMDGVLLSNAALTAQRSANLDRAVELYEKCVAAGYYDEGNIFMRLSLLYSEKGDKASQKATLEKGVELLPENKDVLIYLIDYYLQNNEDPTRLFELTAKAIQNNPTNAYPYYAQGTIYDQLSKSETDQTKAEEYIAEAVKSFDKAAEVDPSYEFSYVGKGQMYFNRAVILNNLASAELDDNKWMVLRKKTFEAFENAIAPLEKVYELTTVPQNKLWAAELLKVIYFNLRSEGAQYDEAYNKWNAIYGELSK